MKAKKKVAVLFGGRSCERDISIITGALVLNCMDREKYEPVPVYMGDDGWYTGEELFDVSKCREHKESRPVMFAAGSRELYFIKRGKLRPLGEIYCAVNCCHGLNGEDGSVAGLMRLAGIPFASPDMLCSSVCMDKAAFKSFAEGIGLPVLPCRVCMRKAFFENRALTLDLAEKKIGYPAIVKPARLGSSLGIRTAADRNELNAAMEYAFRFDCKIIVERKLEGFYDVNCAAYRHGPRIITSEPEKPKAEPTFFTFEEKYINGLKGAEGGEFPAKLDAGAAERIKELTSLIYRKLYACGVIRVDYLVRGGEIFVGEVNTVPGSLSLYLFRSRTAEYGEVVTELIEEGVRAQREYESIAFEFGTDMLARIGAKGGKRR